MPSMGQALAPPRPRTNDTAGGGEGMVLATADAMAGGEAHVLGGTVLFFFFLTWWYCTWLVKLRDSMRKSFFYSPTGCGGTKYEPLIGLDPKAIIRWYR